MKDRGSWIQDTRYEIQDTGYGMLDAAGPSFQHTLLWLFKYFPDLIAYGLQLFVGNICRTRNAEATLINIIGAVVLLNILVTGKHPQLIHRHPERAALHLVVV